MLHAEGLKGLIIFLVVAGVVVPLFHRARIGTVLGFLIAGVVLGPHGLGRLAGSVAWLDYVTFDDPARGAVLAEFGIIILLFLLGLELSLERFWQLRRYVLGVGLAQVALSTLAIGLSVRLAGGAQPAGIVLGLCLALSSTAIVMQHLIEQHRAANQVGRIALSVLLFQDLMVVPILFVVGILAGDKGAGGGIVPLIRPFAEALAAVIGIMLFGRFVLRPLLHSAVRTGSRDLIMAITLLILVMASVATGLAGLSVALGAFLAGLLLSDSEARHHIEVDLEPFKGFLLGIFFISVGTNIDVVGIVADAGWILLAVVAADQRQGGDPFRGRPRLRGAARGICRSRAAAGAGRRIRLCGYRCCASRCVAAAATCGRRGRRRRLEHAGDAATGANCAQARRSAGRRRSAEYAFTWTGPRRVRQPRGDRRYWAGRAAAGAGA